MNIILIESYISWLKKYRYNKKKNKTNRYPDSIICLCNASASIKFLCLRTSNLQRGARLILLGLLRKHTRLKNHYLLLSLHQPNPIEINDESCHVVNYPIFSSSILITLPLWMEWKCYRQNVHFTLNSISQGKRELGTGVVQQIYI